MSASTRRRSTDASDGDGVRDLLERPLAAGDYRLEFDVARGASGRSSPASPSTFEIRDTGRSYHVPLLLAPYGMTTYRGS